MAKTDTLFEDSNLNILNNSSEHSIKPFVIGGKTGYLAIRKRSQSQSILYSLIETAKAIDSSL